jgi:hypothetical protein
MGRNLLLGIVLGVFVAFWTLVMGISGWYKHPTMVAAFWLVIPLEFGLLYWLLRKQATDGAGYGKQILNSLVFSLVASAVIFPASWLFTSVLFPNYFAELEAIQRQMMASAGENPEAIETAIRQAAPFQNSLVNALMGVMGTIATALLFSAVVAIWVRRKA